MYDFVINNRWSESMWMSGEPDTCGSGVRLNQCYSTTPTRLATLSLSIDQFKASISENDYFSCI
jgi:hypothetical protein